MNEQAQLGDAWVRRRARLSRGIEEATLRCFLERGIEDVTVDDIATAAGVSRRTFYRYFPTPLAVLAELPRRGLERLIESFQARPLEESLVEAFVHSIEKSYMLDQEEMELRALSAEVLRRWPIIWRQTLGGMQNESIQHYTRIIGQRLEAEGKDTRPASVLAATLSAVIVQLTSDHRGTGAFSIEPEEFRWALRSIGGAFTD